MIPREELMRVRRLASKANQRIKDWSFLGDASVRNQLGLTLAEGAKLAGEGLSALGGCAFKPASLLVSDSGAERPEAGELFELAGKLGIERLSLSDDVYAKISGLKSADGLALLLAFQPGSIIAPNQFSQPGAKWLVAAGVQDPGNAGALARTALAAGCTGCVFAGGADPFSPKFLRGSMGAAFRLPCLSMELVECGDILRREGMMVVTATADLDAIDYREIDFTPPLAVLVGGERGIPDELANLSGKKARIPLQGGVESLNLAVAAGVILFEAAKHWEK